MPVEKGTPTESLMTSQNKKLLKILPKKLRGGVSLHT